MVCTTCENCGNKYHWDWSEAFSKFGFNDGDGLVQTPYVAEILEEVGYSVKFSRWSPHNTLIYSIIKGGVEYIPDESSKYRIGYDDPQIYLHDDILTLLDNKLP